MDKLTAFACVMFIISDVCAGISLGLPDWIITDVGGETKLGLLWSCETLYNRTQVCYSPNLKGAWLFTFLAIFVGCGLVTCTILTLITSHFVNEVGALRLLVLGRWIGFSSMVLFCLAAVVFPMGFHMEEIGGQPYQLPNSFKVGYSYIFFVLALWLTVVSELFAGKVCLPHF